MYVHVIVLEVWLIVNNEMEFKAIPPLILSVELVLAFLLALYLLHRYANLRKQNPFATVSTLVVWFLSFAIIFLLPVDVSSVSGNYNNYVLYSTLVYDPYRYHSTHTFLSLRAFRF